MSGETPEVLSADQQRASAEAAVNPAPEEGSDTPDQQLERLQVWLDESGTNSTDLAAVLGDDSDDLLQGVDERTRSVIQAAFLLGQTSTLEGVRELLQQGSTGDDQIEE